jgi:hypothetical protein
MDCDKLPIIYKDFLTLIGIGKTAGEVGKIQGMG